jgi:hypothetical protein
MDEVNPDEDDSDVNNSDEDGSVQEEDAAYE